MTSLQDLKDELTNDPLGRGYAGMTDTEAAASLGARNRPRQRATLAGTEILECINAAEFIALGADARARVQWMTQLGDAVPIGASSKARAILLNAFPSGATFNALAAAVVEQISRAEEVLGGELPGIYGFRTAAEAVAAARALA